MCIKDDGTRMQWQIQLGSVEVAPTQLIMNLLSLKCFGVLRAPISALPGPPNPKGLATPMKSTVTENIFKFTMCICF